MTFLYFVPKLISNPVQNVGELVAAGVTIADPNDPTFSYRSNYVASGPGGQAGAIASLQMPDGTDGPAPVYRPAQQRWRKHPGGRHWVGVMLDALPSPQSLRRPNGFVLGRPARLIDGNEWIVPACVPAEVRGMGGATLPKRYDLDDAGELVATVRDEYRGIAGRAYAYFQRFLGDVAEPEGDEAREQMIRADVELAVELLSINYRLGRFEAIAVLGLLGSDEYGRVLNAAIEAEAIEAAVAEAEATAKKALAPAGSATSDGTTAGPTPAVSSSATSSSPGT